MPEAPLYWIVGQLVAKTAHGVVWEFQGVFNSEELARAVCKDTSYFIAPARLNEACSENSVEWIGARFPMVEA